MPGSPKGTAVTVWTDDNGYLDSPPLALSEVASQADAATIGVIVGRGRALHRAARRPSGSCLTAAGWPPGTPTGWLPPRRGTVSAGDVGPRLQGLRARRVRR